MFRKINTLVLLQLVLFISMTTSQDLNPDTKERKQSADGKRRQKTCEDGMKMVHQYLETSKIELIENIRAAKSAQCKLQAWKKVDQSMVAHTHSHGVKFKLAGDQSWGLKITAKATETGCGPLSKGSSLTVHFKGDWKQIMYTQVFKGSCKCWRIFGAAAKDSSMDSGLERLSRSMGDLIFGQKKMKSSKENTFDGVDTGCGGFWGPENGSGERQATVMLRRKKGAKDAGIYTRTFCGDPEYEIKDIYVLM